MDLALPVRRVVLTFDAPRDRPVPDFAGNLWRGALGHALRASACRTGATSCDGCAERDDCDYSYVFDTPTPADASRMRLYPQVPHPYILRELKGGQDGQVALLLTLVGRSIALEPLVVAALAKAAVTPPGIGGQRMQMRARLHESSLGRGDWRPSRHGAESCAGNSASASMLAGPNASQTPVASPVDGEVRIALQTILRVRRDGHAIEPSKFTFADLFVTLMRRISMLCMFHGPAPLDVPFARLADSARQVNARVSLTSARVQRHSARQAQSMTIDGVEGHIDIDAADARRFWPFLWLGQFVHAGGLTTMGLGAYELRLVATTLRADGRGEVAGTITA